MMLSTLKESYQEFKNQNPNVKVGLSYFVNCRPRNCVYLGSKGTHAVCVCTIHQNVKLMLFGTFVFKGLLENFSIQNI